MKIYLTGVNSGRGELGRKWEEYLVKEIGISKRLISYFFLVTEKYYSYYFPFMWRDK
jgi:hypothetical protein